MKNRPGYDALLETMRKMHERPKIPRQKDLAAIVWPADRPRDWIKYNDVVVFVLVGAKGRVRLRAGHICSWPGSHGCGMEVDNIKKTIVWSQDEIRVADNADDAHEQEFDPKDPTLLRLDEIGFLRDPARAVEWFAGRYPVETACEIARLLSLPDLGYEEERKESADFYAKLHAQSEVNMKWWAEHGCPAPQAELDRAL